MDFITAKTIGNAPAIPFWASLAVNQAYYALHILFPAFFVLYILVLTGRLDLRKRGILLLLAPAAACELALLTNPVTGVFFRFDASMRYSRGAWQPLLYLEGMFYLVASLALLLRYRGAIGKEQRSALLCSVCAVAVAMLIQQMHPQYLVTGVALALTLAMVYFTLQNPDSMLDIMSGTFNYSALLLFLRDQFEGKREFQIVALELCDMRRINSLFGLDAGNRAIGMAGSYLRAGRERAWVFRMTGTRYVLITHSEDDWRGVMERVARRFAEPWQVGEISMMLSVQVRYFLSAKVLEHPGEVVNLLDAAFAELPEVNAEGVSALEIDQKLLSVIYRRLAVETALRQALQTGEGFELYFQPVYSLEKERFTMAEALLRFRHPFLGEISPSEFIPIAEKNGLAAQIDEWVVRSVCAFIRRHSLQTRLGLERLEINLSAAGILQYCASDKLLEITDSFGVRPSFLMFEITETAATTTHDLLRRCMTELEKHGVLFALDDFGAGYANLAQVVNLPFHAVKIDRSLLVRESGVENAAIVFEETVRMFRRMGKVTVVEGVETKREIERVQSLRADYIQGYAYARPMRGEELLALLSAGETGLQVTV